MRMLRIAGSRSPNMRVQAAEWAYCRQQEHRSHDFAQSSPSPRIGARRCPGFGMRVGLGHEPQELVGGERQDAERIRTTRVSEAIHELSLWLDEPGGLARSLSEEISFCRPFPGRRFRGWWLERGRLSYRSRARSGGCWLKLRRKRLILSRPHPSGGNGPMREVKGGRITSPSPGPPPWALLRTSDGRGRGRSTPSLVPRTVCSSAVAVPWAGAE